MNNSTHKSNLLQTNATNSINNNNNKLIEFNDLKKISIIKNAEVNRLPSNIYAYGSKQLAGEYKEEIGLRIAVLFGSMVTLNCLLNR